MAIKGAGGTRGGTGSFILGFLMMCAGFYMLMQSIIVTNRFGFGAGLFSFGFFGTQLNVTGGMVLVPFMFGVGIVFYNSKNILGWGLVAGSIVALVVGVISNIHLVFRNMTLFELLTILVLALGGLGLFLRSLRDGGAPETEEKS